MNGRPDDDAAVRYAGLMGGLSLGLILATRLSPDPAWPAALHTVVFAGPAAVYMARGHVARAWGLVGAALASAILAGHGGASTLVIAGFALSGLILGAGLGHGRTFSRLLTEMTLFIFGFAAAGVALGWRAWQEQAAMARAAAETQLEAADTETARAAAEWSIWLYEHWVSLGFGLLFAASLFGALAALGGVAWWLGRFENEPEPGYRLRDIRPPDWLTWVVIAAIAGWFAARQWPDTLLQPVSWNLIAALIAVYWLNGLLIAVYGMCALGVPMFMRWIIMLALLYVGAVGVFAGFGLFDTWLELRGRFDRWAQARRGEEP